MVMFSACHKDDDTRYVQAVQYKLHCFGNAVTYRALLGEDPDHGMSGYQPSLFFFILFCVIIIRFRGEIVVEPAYRLQIGYSCKLQPADQVVYPPLDPAVEIADDLPSERIRRLDQGFLVCAGIPDNTDLPPEIIEMRVVKHQRKVYLCNRVSIYTAFYLGRSSAVHHSVMQQLIDLPVSRLHS